MGVRGHGGGSFGSQGFGSGNSAFGRSQAGNPHTGSGNSFFGRNTSGEAKARSTAGKSRKMTKSAKAMKLKKAKRTIAAKKQTSRGNSDFGHRQGDATTRTTGSQNSAFGQARAAEARGDTTTTGTAVVSDGATQTGPGNSDFGHRQGDATTRTTGSQNSAFGQARAAEAKASPTPTPSQ